MFNLGRISRRRAVRSDSQNWMRALHGSHRGPIFLPDGKHFLYLAINHEASANDTIYYASPSPLTTAFATFG